MTNLNLKEFYAQSLGIKVPWRVVSVSFLAEEKVVEVRVELVRGTVWADPGTRERAHVKDWTERRWRHLDTCEFRTEVVAKVPRVLYSDGRTETVAVPWAEPHGRFTMAMEGHVIELIRQCRTTRGAARLAGISEDQADGVMRRAVARGLSRRDAVAAEHLGIDEKAIRKGHRYASVLSDLESGAVLDVVEERTGEAAEKLFGSLPGEIRAEVKAVAMDMWPAFIGAASKLLPGAAVVFDKFHVAAHLNKAVDLVRRREHRALAAKGGSPLAKTKYLWLRTPGDLRRAEESGFRALINSNLRTGRAWALKESFKRFWDYKAIGAAGKFLLRWLGEVRTTGFNELLAVADMIERHMAGLLNHIIFPITNAAAEGINSSIQSLKHSARGLPNFQSFRTRILFHLGKLDLKPAL